MNAVLAFPADVEADLFGDAIPPAGATAPAAPLDLRLTFSGVLAAHAEVRTKLLDGCIYVPALCLDIEHVGSGHHRVHAEQLFTEATRADAEALAHRLRKGQRVTVTTALADMRLFLPAATLSTPH